MLFLQRLLPLLAILALPTCISAVPLAVLHSAQPRAPRFGIDPVSDFVLPMVYDGAGYSTTFLLTNCDTKLVHVVVYFFANDGTPATLPIVGVGSATSVFADLDVNQSIKFQSTGQSAALVDGYATVFSLTGPASDPQSQITTGLISGMALFSKSVNGVNVEAVTPISSAFESTAALPFDNTNGLATAVALVNADPNDATVVTLAMYDQRGILLRKDTWTVAPGAKVLVTLPALYGETAGLAGQVVVSGDGRFLAPVGLRFNPSGAFSVLLPWSIDPRLLSQ
jgi:hypothetical protein